MTVHIVVSQEMPASCERTFDLLHDYRHRLAWDTLLRRAFTEADEPPARGVVAVCVARRRFGGYSFRTRYVTFERPTLAAIKLESRPPFFASWAGRPLDGDVHDDVSLQAVLGGLGAGARRAAGVSPRDPPPPRRPRRRAEPRGGLVVDRVERPSPARHLVRDEVSAAVHVDELEADDPAGRVGTPPPLVDRPWPGPELDRGHVGT